MSLFIKGDESYSKHFPIVGATPTLYGFNNLQNIINPYLNRMPMYNNVNNVNRIQMYDGWSGKLLPSFTPGSLMTEMADNLRSNPNYTMYDKERIRSNLYNNDTKKFTIGLIGTDKDIATTRKALDEYLNKTR